MKKLLQNFRNEAAGSAVHERRLRLPKDLLFACLGQPECRNLALFIILSSLAIKQPLVYRPSSACSQELLTPHVAVQNNFNLNNPRIYQSWYNVPNGKNRRRNHQGNDRRRHIGDALILLYEARYGPRYCQKYDFSI